MSNNEKTIVYYEVRRSEQITETINYEAENFTVKFKDGSEIKLDVFLESLKEIIGNLKKD